MDILQNHIIRKQYLDVKAYGDQDGFELQQSLGTMFWNKLKPAMEEVFNEISTPDRVISIEKLDIDLGHIQTANFREAFTERLVTVLKEKLNEYIADRQSEIISKSLEQHTFEQWLTFLKEGISTWSEKGVEESAQLKKVLDQLATNYESGVQLKNQLQSDTYSFDRLVVQHSEAFLQTIAEIYTGEKQDILMNARKGLTDWFRLESVTSIPALKRYLEKFGSVPFKNIFWREVLYDLIVKKSKPKDISEWVILLLKQYVSKEKLPVLANTLTSLEEDKVGKASVHVLSAIRILRQEYSGYGTSHDEQAPSREKPSMVEMIQIDESSFPENETKETKEQALKTEKTNLSSEEQSLETHRLEEVSSSEDTFEESEKEKEEGIKKDHSKTAEPSKERQVEGMEESVSIAKDKEKAEDFSEPHETVTNTEDPANKTEDIDSIVSTPEKVEEEKKATGVDIASPKDQQKADDAHKSDNVDISLAEQALAREMEKRDAINKEIFRSTAEPPKLADIPEDSEFYIENAGMVMLHPFLPAYFGKFGLMEKKDFMDEGARHRAVHLLHYLASGQEGVPEYNLLLPKLICNLPFSIPLEREIALKQEEKDEAEKLLGAVLEHWGALGNTTPDGLREGFLSRDGKLSKRQSGWLLQVETKTMDVLINKLPWGVSMIKLPWMPDLLRVEWG